MSNGDEDGGDADAPDGAGGSEAPDEADAVAGELEGEEPSLEESLESAEEAVDAEDIGEEELSAALDAIETAVEVAETEADLDAVEATLDDVEGALESADLPAPDEEDEEAEDVREALDGRIAELRERIEDARGPYAEDVVSVIESVRPTVTDTRWTETGEREVVEAVESFLARVDDILSADVSADGTDPDELESALSSAQAAVEDADLDPDDDDETIAGLLEAAETLETDIEEAEAWEDLTTREQLEAEGFYDVLGHRKDFPPEWAALKEHEKRGNAEMVLLALDSLGSEFMEEHCLDALRRMAPEAAVEPMLTRAERRDKPAIEILGKIGSEEAIDTIIEYVDTDSDPQLQKTTLKALGEIGSEEATQAVANKLVAENEGVRSYAARALGMIGDPRAIDPLADVLSDDDADTVRASAAWALFQIGTEDALEAASGYAEDRAYLVSTEAGKAADALDAKPA